MTKRRSGGYSRRTPESTEPMPLARRRFLPLVAAALAGCAAEPSEIVFPSGVAQAACGPADGPAVLIDLPLTRTEGPTAPVVRVLVYHARAALPTKTWSLSPSTLDGSASYCRAATDCEGASRGTIRFDRVADELRGSVDLRFPTEGSFRGRFRASWHEVAVLCG